MKKIVLCADDYGQNQFISQAVIALLEKKRLSATSCMTTSPLWPAHAEWLQPLKNQADIGLHFNLTEGKPLSEELVHSHGFMPLSKLVFKSYWRLLNQSAIEAELNRQLDAFEAAIGQTPDFIDGHQHIHQLPVIRNAVLNIYEKRLRAKNTYLRCVHHPKVYSQMNVKRMIIQLLGANAFKKKILKYNIPHNSSFAGIYPFTHSKRYSDIFPRFLDQITDGGVIMCHPGLLPTHDKEPDSIAKARYDEFLYLESNQFVMDCFKAGVTLCRKNLR